MALLRGKRTVAHENVAQTHLVLASGQLVLQKNYCYIGPDGPIPSSLGPKLVKDFAGAEIRTHNLLIHFFLLQPVPFITVLWPPSGLTKFGSPS